MGNNAKGKRHHRQAAATRPTFEEMEKHLVNSIERIQKNLAVAERKLAELRAELSRLE